MSGKPDGGDDDATIKLPRKRPYGRPTDRALIPAGGGIPAAFRLVALICAILIGIAGWFMMRERPPELYSGPSPSEPTIPRIAVQLADEAEILAHVADQTVVFRLAANRRVLVLDFASLREQGLMFNRAAAMVEKVGLPRDRVLRDDELDAAIEAAGDTVETYYFGHDYDAGDLARFYSAADRDGVVLRPQEEWLRSLLAQEGMLAEGARGAVISIPRAGSGEGVDASLRATILRHELSHAEFFTNPAYAAYARRFWREGLDEAGRAAFRRYLSAQNYDAALEDLMINEMQAYLMHTTDQRLFNAESLGVTVEVMDRWQAEFLLGMPNGWLRDACVAALPSAGKVLSRPRRRRKTRQRASDSTRTARVLTRRPRRIASASAA
jgi:hypothetical protein